MLPVLLGLDVLVLIFLTSCLMVGDGYSSFHDEEEAYSRMGVKYGIVG